MFERSDFTNRCLYRGLDGCGPASGQPGKRHCECEEVKKLRGIGAVVTVVG